MEGSTLTQRRAECQLKEREIQTDYMMELGARLALVRKIQREQEKEMKREKLSLEDGHRERGAIQEEPLRR